MARPETPTTGYLLWRVTTKWRAAVDRAVAPLGLTHAQYTLLASLYSLSRTGAKPSQRELADFAGLEPIYVSKLVRALERADLLTRAGHPADPRAVQLSLTRHGEDTALRAIGVVRALHEELTASIGGTRGRRNRELVATLQALLHPPAAGETAQAGPDRDTFESGRSEQVTSRNANQNGSETMAPAPTLTGQDLGEAEGAARALLDEILVGTGLSSDQYIVLRVLTFRGPYDSPAALHEFLAGQRQLRLDHPAVATLLNGLEQRGLVQGTAPDDAGPARLTPDGVALHNRLAETVTRTTTRLYEGFDQDELATTHRVLTGVVARAGQLRGELMRARSGAEPPPSR